MANITMLIKKTIITTISKTITVTIMTTITIIVTTNLFIYQARESSLVPVGFLKSQFLQKLLLF